MARWENSTDNAVNPGADPLIVSYSASAVKTCNASSSLVRFEKNIVFFTEEMF
jgi:hypothetical protein